jgi:hypothetical protein
VASAFELTAVDTKTRSPQTTGLELAIPGMGAFHRTFLPPGRSHVTGAPWPSAIPEPSGPRKEGQGAAARRRAAGRGAEETGAAPAAVAGAAARPMKRRDAPSCTRRYSIVPPRPPNSTHVSLPSGPRKRRSPIGTSRKSGLPSKRATRTPWSTATSAPLPSSPP